MRVVIVRAAGVLVGAAQWGCFVAFAAFCGLTLVQVVNRYALGLPMFWTEEVVLLLFVWSVLLGLPVALWRREEIVVDVVSFAPGRLERARGVLVDLCSLAFAGVLAWSGLQLVERGGAALSPALGLPRSVFYASIPIGAVLAAVAIAARRLRPAGRPVTMLEDGDADRAHD